MGVRFFLALKSNEANTRVNLNSVCDVIVDDSIAIECKYIHSPSNLVKNISKAKQQIEERVNNKQAKFGFIALDLSNICPRERIKDFVNYTLNKFIENYETLESKNRINGDIMKQIIEDNNFCKIISLYIMTEVETSFYSELGFSYNLGANTFGIIFQSMNSFVFEYKGNIFPITTRGMTYFLNSSLDKQNKLGVQKFLHQLAVGV